MVFRLQGREFGQVGGDFKLAAVQHGPKAAHKLELRHAVAAIGGARFVLARC